MTRKSVTDEQFGRLQRRLGELARRVDEGSVEFEPTMSALQLLVEGKRLIQQPLGEAEGDPYRSGSQSESAGVVEYFTPLSDIDVPAEHQETLAKYRKLAAEYGVANSVPLCYRVTGGFTLKDHAPQAGRCFRAFGYLKDWNFADKPTKYSLAFWVPRLVKGSTSKTVDEQRQLLPKLRKRLELPEHHLSGFGEASLVAGLILAQFKATGERVPASRMYARTDTCLADGKRLDLGGFDEGGLCCDIWHQTGENPDNLGVFALGVELGS